MKTATEYLVSFGHEYTRMIKDPVYAAYGGIASDAGRRAYITRRFVEIRTGLRPYLHREEVQALADDINTQIDALR